MIKRTPAISDGLAPADFWLSDYAYFNSILVVSYVSPNFISFNLISNNLFGVLLFLFIALIKPDSIDLTFMFLAFHHNIKKSITTKQRNIISPL